MLNRILAVRPTTTLQMPVRPLMLFTVVLCSVTLPCSDSLVCGEEMTARFYWDTL